MEKIFWIADDDPDDRMIIREAFEENDGDQTLLFFEDGEMVMAQFKERLDFRHYPSLLILDLNMPKINGLELLGLIKNDANTKHIPVVILSTSKNKQDKEKGMNLGADDFITKPFSFEQMINITKGLIEKYG
ncbi:response regulator [Pedobacter sp. SD-b]|uniref:Response regulator n=1 Tax=Pedobacter segetis TaxID=2793069 RepID=A0ABS1BHW9_9SPHI|nr:response regulator [Pedobacter segetis]MBK0381956.1 response regulator [Pedobacter segetis]